MSQEEFGDRGGVTKKSQGLYERGGRAPDASYLTAIAEDGADVLYIITGQRAQPMIPAGPEADILAAYRKLTVGQKRDALSYMQDKARLNEFVRSAKDQEAKKRPSVTRIIDGRKVEVTNPFSRQDAESLMMAMEALTGVRISDEDRADLAERFMGKVAQKESEKEAKSGGHADRKAS